MQECLDFGINDQTIVDGNITLLRPAIGESRRPSSLEPARQQVDAYLPDWITRQPPRRAWFFEQRDGNCRLMAPIAVFNSLKLLRLGAVQSAGCRVGGVGDMEFRWQVRW